MKVYIVYEIEDGKSYVDRVFANEEDARFYVTSGHMAWQARDMDELEKMQEGLFEEHDVIEGLEEY